MKNNDNAWKELVRRNKEKPISKSAQAQAIKYKREKLKEKVRQAKIQEKEKSNEEKEKESRDKRIIGLLNKRLSRPGKILKSGSRATIKIEDSKYNSILKERNLYFR